MPTLYPSQMMVYSCGESLRANKLNIVKACGELGATPEITRLAVAVAMGESQICCATQRDCSKDGTPSANYSCFNMNQDMLQQLGWVSNEPDLNDNANVKHAISYIIKAVDTYGLDGFLHFHRGGRSGLADGKAYGAQEYAGAIKTVMRELELRPEHLSDDVRLAYDIVHV